MSQINFPSQDLRERIRKTVTDIAEARDTPPEQFPGHREVYCANLEGWLGGFALPLLHTLEGTEYALQVLVAMADEDELAALETTLEEEATTASRDALVAARRKVEADIAAYQGES